MKVYLVNRFFWPDESATALLLTELAEDLSAGGHEVQVFTSRQLYNNPEANLARHQVWQGIEIQRLDTTCFGRKSFGGRLLDIISFHLSLRFRAKNISRPDAWFVMTDPPLILNTVIKLRQRLGGRLVHQVADLYPDLAVALGSLPERGFLVDWLQRRSIRGLLQCDEVLALGNCMAAVLKSKGVPEAKITVLPPWADGTKLYPMEHRENSFRRGLGFGREDFVVMYSGNMGAGHRFEAILEAARSLTVSGRASFVFIGEGAKRGEIEAFREKHRLDRLRLLPYQPKERLRETLSVADVHLISLDARVQGLIVPSKLAGILAVGRPAIFVGAAGNSVAESIIRGGCGYLAPEDDAERLMGIIDKLSGDAELRSRLGKNARRLFEMEYNRATVTPQIISRLENE